MTVKINAIDQIIERDERNNFYNFTVRIDNAQFSDFLVFPNPAIDFMTLFLRDENFSGVVTMTISDVKGNIRYSEEGFRKREEEFIRKFDVSQLGAGLYVLSLDFQFGGKKSILFYTGL